MLLSDRFQMSTAPPPPNTIGPPLPAETALNVRVTLLWIALPTLLSISLWAQAPQQPDPPKPSVKERVEALLERARHLSDIRSPDAPAFRLKATFSFIGDNLETVEGTYTETWTSNSQWRRETIIGNLRQIDVGAPGKHWLLYPDGFPVQANALPSLMAFLPPASLELDYSFIRERATPHLTAQCAYSRPVIENLQSVFCFEKTTGVLLERVFPEKRSRNNVVSSCEYGTFHGFGQYTFPREVVCFEDRHKKISANVVELTLEPPMDPALFDPPHGSIELGICSGKTVAPTLSMNEFMIPGLDPEHVAWLKIWFVVDIKGKVQDLRALRSAAKNSNAKTLASVRNWRFTPGTCDGRPMPMQLTLEIPSTPR
jgi:hypothetical protein